MFVLRTLLLSIVVAIEAFSNSVSAAVTTYTNFNQWSAAVGGHKTMDFTGFSAGTLITTQYSHLGAVFTDGDDLVDWFNPPTYPQDGWGLAGSPSGSGDIDIVFDEPQYAIAAHIPRGIHFWLYNKGELVYFTPVSGIPGPFAGLSGDIAFDSVTIISPFGSTFVDNIYFAVPAPGALSLLALAGISIGSRRRTQ